MGVSSLLALSASLRLLVAASQASSLDDPHVLLPTAQANAAKPAENLATVHPFVAQDLEDRGFQSELLLDAIESILRPTRSSESSTSALRDEGGKVERLILGHLSTESDKLPGVNVMHREGPVDVRFTGEAYERACEHPVVKTPAFARLYDDRVKRIGAYAALREFYYRPGGDWQLTAIHNEMLEQAQFASWFKAAMDPKLLEEGATIDKVELASQFPEPEKVAKSYDIFINRVLKLSSSYVDNVGSQTSSIFAKFKAGEHQIASESTLSKEVNIRKALDTYSGATTPVGVEDPDILSLKEEVEELMFGIWFRSEIDPVVFKKQRLNQYKWLEGKSNFLTRYTTFINKQLTEVRKLNKKRPRDGLNEPKPKRERTAY